MVATHHGKPCKHGHGTLRYDSDNHCVVCRRAPRMGHQAYTRQWYQDNKAKVADYSYRRNYGITQGDYDRMLVEQGGGCAICGREAWEERCGKLHVDHCHASGKVRGLLCEKCNHGIGEFRDDPVLLVQAVAYLEASRG